MTQLPTVYLVTEHMAWPNDSSTW